MNPYIYVVVCDWSDLAHPLTPLYPVPDPDDDEAVEALLKRPQLTYWDNTPYPIPATLCRAVLRALREEQG
jgi:hypothetical protein